MSQETDQSELIGRAGHVDFGLSVDLEGHPGDQFVLVHIASFERENNGWREDCLNVKFDQERHEKDFVNAPGPSTATSCRNS